MSGEKQGTEAERLAREIARMPIERIIPAMTEALAAKDRERENHTHGELAPALERLERLKTRCPTTWMEGCIDVATADLAALQADLAAKEAECCLHGGTCAAGKKEYATPSPQPPSGETCAVHPYSVGINGCPDRGDCYKVPAPSASEKPTCSGDHGSDLALCPECDPAPPSGTPEKACECRCHDHQWPSEQSPCRECCRVVSRPPDPPAAPAEPEGDYLYELFLKTPAGRIVVANGRILPPTSEPPTAPTPLMTTALTTPPGWVYQRFIGYQPPAPQPETVERHRYVPCYGLQPPLHKCWPNACHRVEYGYFCGKPASDPVHEEKR